MMFRRAEKKSIRLGFWNDSKVPRLIAVEPLGEDYTLLPGEELEIEIANEPPALFNLVEGSDFTQVYLENMTIDNMTKLFTVRQKGVEIKCGHNSQHNPHR